MKRVGAVGTRVCFIVLAISFCSAMQGSVALRRLPSVFRSLTHAGSQQTVPTVRTALIMPRRTIIPDQALIGTLETAETASHSPLLATLTESVVKEALKNKSNKYTELFFGITPEGALRDTRLPGNPLMSATTEELGIFSKKIGSGFEAVEGFVQSPVVENWHARHLKDLGRFKELLSFQKELRSIAKKSADQAPEVVNTNFSLLTYLKGHTAQDLKKFYNGLGIEYTTAPAVKELHTIVPKNVEAMSRSEVVQEFENAYAMLKNKSDLSALAVPSIRAGYKEQLSAPLCVEESVRSFLQTLLYDPVTKQLTLSKLPNSVHPSEGLKEFIQKYTDVNAEGYYKKSAQAWLDIVSDLQGVRYKLNSNKGNYELLSDEENVVALCNKLFNLQERSLKEIASELSTATRKVAVEGGSANEFKVQVVDGHFTASGLLELKPVHASFALDQAASEALSLEQAAYLTDLSKSISKHHTLLEFVKDKALFKFLEDAKEMRRPDLFKKILEAKKWDVTGIDRDQSLLEMAAYDKEFFSLLLQEAEKGGLNFTERALNNSLRFAVCDAENLIMLLQQAEKQGVGFSEEALSKSLIWAALDKESLGMLLQQAKKQGTNFSEQALSESLSSTAGDKARLAMLLQQAEKQGVGFSEEALSKSLFSTAYDTERLTLLLQQAEKQGVGFSEQALSKSLSSTAGDKARLAMLLQQAEKQGVGFSEEALSKSLSGVAYNKENLALLLRQAEKQGIRL